MASDLSDRLRRRAVAVALAVAVAQQLAGPADQRLGRAAVGRKRRHRDPGGEARRARGRRPASSARARAGSGSVSSSSDLVVAGRVLRQQIAGAQRARDELRRRGRRGSSSAMRTRTSASATRRPRPPGHTPRRAAPRTRRGPGTRRCGGRARRRCTMRCVKPMVTASPGWSGTRRPVSMRIPADEGAVAAPQVLDEETRVRLDVKARVQPRREVVGDAHLAPRRRARRPPTPEIGQRMRLEHVRRHHRQVQRLHHRGVARRSGRRGLSDRGGRHRARILGSRPSVVNCWSRAARIHYHRRVSPRAAASSARPTSATRAKRRAGSRSRQRWMAASQAGSTSGSASCSGRGGSCFRRSTVASGVGPGVEGAAAAQHLVKDEAERVDVGRRAAGPGSACSGAMYSGVPTSSSLSVSRMSRLFRRSARCRSR